MSDAASDGGLSERRVRLGITLVLLAIAGGGAIDLALDRPQTLWSVHVLFELATLCLVSAAMVALWAQWRGAARSLERTRHELATRSDERDAWRRRAETLLRGLGAAIDDQLRVWGLTRVEAETALLLLKGFGLKEIAALQEKSERTVRQHAIAVYRKSGLSGRAELSAFFLEDLLLPGSLAGVAGEERL